MNESEPTNDSNFNWQEENLNYLLCAIEQVQQFLEGQATIPLPDIEPWPIPPALEQLCRLFKLSEFERKVIVFCAGMSLSPRLPALIETVSEGQFSAPTFSLALLAFPQADCHTLNPHATLRHWQIVIPEGTAPLFLRPLVLDETIFHYLLGQPCFDPQLTGLVKLLVPNSTTLPPSHQALVDRAISAWSGPQPIALQLVGADRAACRSIVARASQQLGYTALLVSPHLLEPETSKIQQFCQRLKRQAFLGGNLVFLDCNLSPEIEPLPAKFLSQIVEQLSPPFALSSPQSKSLSRDCIILDVELPTTVEQLQLWQTALGDLGTERETELTTLAQQYRLDFPTIQTIAACVRSESLAHDASTELLSNLHQNCRRTIRSQLDELAQRLKTGETLDDLILPDTQKKKIQELIAHFNNQNQVYARWGFNSRSNRGLGIIALFSGSSGTGKTMAANAIASALNLDLYRIDLSALVSKYIGETEKNLRRIFDAADRGGVVLLFDEADALFSRRSEVKSSNDRYANMEVSYLLQRIEAYRGLAILTTNLKNAIDFAFLRTLLGGIFAILP